MDWKSTKVYLKYFVVYLLMFFVLSVVGMFLGRSTEVAINTAENPAQFFTILYALADIYAKKR